MGSYDFGYTWVWTHGHLVVAAAFGLLAGLVLWRRWPRWIAVLPAGLALWALTGFLITQLVFQPNRPLERPTQAFARAGTGTVVDLGAGSGRSTLMVLLARPNMRATALDIFSGYFGIDDNTPERIRANARAAGVEERLEVRTGDMRAMPFADASFDAAVSAFAIDHLDREGVTRALAEVTRVLRPGGEFLLIIINVDGWVRVAYPFPHGHGYFSTAQNEERWRSAIHAAGLQLTEQGTQPGMLYFVSRKAPPSDAGLRAAP